MHNSVWKWLKLFHEKKTCCGHCEGVDKHFNATISEIIFVWNWLVFGVDDSCICGNNKTNMKIY